MRGHNITHPHLTRRHRDVHEWNEDARIAHDGSAWWGADATANAYVTTKDTAIGNKEAVFWLCHKLAIVPTFMPDDPRCAVSCDKGGRETLKADASKQRNTHDKSLRDLQKEQRSKLVTLRTDVMRRDATIVQMRNEIDHLKGCA